jgi:hypothetical protein
MAAMPKTVEITAEAFAAYLKCPTKGYLVARGEKGMDTFWTEIRARLTEAYKAKATNRSAWPGPPALKKKPEEIDAETVLLSITSYSPSSAPASSDASRESPRSTQLLVDPRVLPLLQSRTGKSSVHSY